MNILWPVYIAVRIIMGIGAMVSNLLTLVCMYKYTYLRSTANILVASLALSDFLHGALTTVVLLFRELPSSTWDISHILCLTGICVETTTVFAQYASFSMLAVERRNSLRFQLHQGKKWDRKTLLYILSAMWTTIAIYNISMTIIYSDVPEGTVCNIRYYFPGYYMYVGVAIFIVTCICISFGYGHIAYIANKSNNQIAPAQESATTKNDMKITRMMGMVLGIFLLVYIPFSIALLMLKPTSPQWQKSLYYLSILLYDINFWINPFIYAWRDKGFNRAFRQILSACPGPCCREQALADGGSGVVDNDAARPLHISVIPMSHTLPSTADTAADSVVISSTARRLIPRSP